MCEEVEHTIRSNVKVGLPLLLFPCSNNEMKNEIQQKDVFLCTRIRHNMGTCMRAIFCSWNIKYILHAHVSMWHKTTILFVPEIPTQVHAFFFRFFLSFLLCFESLPDDESDLSCEVNKYLPRTSKFFSSNNSGNREVLHANLSRSRRRRRSRERERERSRLLRRDLSRSRERERSRSRRDRPRERSLLLDVFFSGL